MTLPLYLKNGFMLDAAVRAAGALPYVLGAETGTEE